MRSSHQYNFAAVCGFFIVALAAATSAQAHTFCVSSSVDLRDALAAASDNGANNHENNTIKIVRGVYSAGTTEFSFNSTDPHTLDINGGYNQDCTALIENPALTILRGGNSRVLESHSTAGDVSLRFLAFTNGFVTGSFTAHGGGVLINSYEGDNGPVIIDQNIFVNNYGTESGGAFFIGLGGNATLQFENNLVVLNGSDSDGGGGVIVNNGSGITFINNTFFGNTITNAPANTTGGVAFEGLPTGPETLSNNIFWGSSGYDLSTNAVLVNNDYAMYNGSPGVGSTGNVALDPMFLDVGAVPDFHLSAASPLRGLGTLTPVGGLPSIDIAGLPRQFNSLVDMGAYEYGDEIFKDGFDD